MAKINGAPAVYHLGTDDMSTRPDPWEPVKRPQHCPLYLIFAQRGGDDRRLMSGAEAEKRFGAASFDERSKFFTHQTLFAKGTFAEGNACVMKRLIPDDAPPPARMRLSLDVLPTTVPIYVRNIDGSFKLDASGNKVTDGTAPGYICKWVKTTPAPASEANGYGVGTIQPGTQTAGGVTSDLYPIRDFMVSSQGEGGNDVGIRVWAPRLNAMSNPNLLENERVYPYAFSVVSRATAKDVPTVETGIFGQRVVSATLKENVIDTTSDRDVSFDAVFLPAYNNTTDIRYAWREGEFGHSVGYADNLEHLLGLFHTAEIPFMDDRYDFTDSEDDIHLFNIVSGMSSTGVPYQTFRLIDGTGSVRLTEYNNLMCGGGGDGTLSNEMFETLVLRELERYQDEDDVTQDIAVNPESVFYDSGFTNKVRIRLPAITGLRKDVRVVCGTYTFGTPRPAADDHLATAVLVRSAAQMTPESIFFGTPVTRCVIVGGAGRIYASRYKGLVPATYHMMKKSARQMGSSDGKWKRGERFSSMPGSEVVDMFDMDAKFLGPMAKAVFWDTGLNWPQFCDMETIHYPAMKTTYDNDTSVLNSPSVAAALCELVKITDYVARYHQGIDDMSDAQVVTSANKMVSELVKGIFDEKFVIEPGTFVSENDAQRGNSFTLPVTLYADNMKTRVTTYIVARRKSDLTS